jgi:hypothetical protein
MSICEKLSKDIVRDCANPPIKGIDQRLIIINEKDLPASGITFDATFPSALITQIGLLAGTTGYEVEGIKSIMNFTNSFENPEDAESGLGHSIAGIRVNDPSEEIRNEVNKYIAGQKCYAVLERKWKGTENKYAFLFFGLKFGLELTELADSSNENDGTIVMTLGTPSGYKEPFLPHVYRDTDYDTSLATFNNKFAVAAQ